MQVSEAVLTRRRIEDCLRKNPIALASVTAFMQREGFILKGAEHTYRLRYRIDGFESLMIIQASNETEARRKLPEGSTEVRVC